jgi:arylsulfatase A-like enzyme
MSSAFPPRFGPLVALFAGALLLSSSSRAASAAGARPNIVVIIADQFVVRGMSAAGNAHVRTPAIDSLAATGTRFEKSYCTYPVCTPARASWITSRMPHELGILSNQINPGIPDNVPTLGDTFRRAGYRTAWAGKWHIPAPYPGFLTGDRAKIPGFDVVPLEGPGHRANTSIGPGMGSDPATAKAALKFLAEPHERPYLLVVSFLNPHDICEYPREPNHYPKPPSADADLPPLPENFRATVNEPSVIAEDRARTLRPGSDLAGWGDRQWREYRWMYNHLTGVVDELIGQVLGALRKTADADNTLIIFTSDHGEMGGSHQLKTKLYMYEESVAVPLIVCPPARSSGSFVPGVDRSHLVSGLDVFPTLCDFAGVPIPAGLAGASVRPLVEARGGDSVRPWRNHLVSEVNGGNDSRMLRTARFKYVVYAQGTAREQFFDLETDPGETKNLIADPALAGEAARHRQLLAEWQRETKDEFGTATTGDAKSVRRRKAK